MVQPTKKMVTFVLDSSQQPRFLLLKRYYFLPNPKAVFT